ncbi:hypothetical protein ACH4GG_27470 [Streptomyces albidoflavus]|uniref:DUF6197 family protein n=1 Tax=Streptomyces albidoflavus TaxID=1886 RepID=UPI00101E26AF|nr:hypothetical protein [Streptomyces albidoflavus]RZE18368.1 hypothetical protein C0Q96_28730 [Streptomyces albidoflavus]
MNTSPSNATKVADLLERAAAHIDRVGWTQGDWHEETPGLQPKDSPACADGALSVVAYGRPCGAGARTPDQFALHSAAVTALIRHIGAGLIDWNDAEGRTKEQVVGAMRAAAAEQRKRMTDAEREDQRLADQRANEDAYRADYDATGGPRFDTTQPFGSLPDRKVRRAGEDRHDHIRAMARLAHREGPWG